MGTVNDIIDFNNLDNRQVMLKALPFDLVKTVSAVCGAFAAAAQEKALNYECFIDERLGGILVRGDELRLSQILFHLIGNAVKFTTKGFVSIHIAEAPEGANGVQVRVAFKIEDSGIGISRDKQVQLLNPFKLVLPRTQRQSQSTLGLAIACQLLKLHGSDLEIVSQEGRGSTFLFSLVYELAAEQAQADKPGITAGSQVVLSGLRVLVVDDEKLNLMVAKKILAKWGILADEAADGKMALDMCLERDYDVILMDINMPVMDGFEAARAIKAIRKAGFVAPRIVALTASVGTAADEVLRHPYIDDCVLKPFKPEVLREKLL